MGNIWRKKLIFMLAGGMIPSSDLIPLHACKSVNTRGKYPETWEYCGCFAQIRSLHVSSKLILLLFDIVAEKANIKRKIFITDTEKPAC